MLTAYAMFRKIARWAHLDEKNGVAAIEYAMLGTLIVIVAAAAATSVGTSLSTALHNISAEILTWPAT